MERWAHENPDATVDEINHAFAIGLGDLGLLDGIKVLGSDVQTIKDVEPDAEFPDAAP